MLKTTFTKYALKQYIPNKWHIIRKINPFFIFFTTQINHFVTFILHFDFNKISNNTIKQLKI